MKKSYVFLGILALPLLFLNNAFSQTSDRPDKLYTMSGIGFAFPIGETADYLKPKFSTSLGLNLGLGGGGLFLYPKVSLHAYSFNELNPVEGYDYGVRNGRATTYLLNLALGYRKIINSFAFYGFAGGGGGFILTPQVDVDESFRTASLDNKSNGMGILETGLGLEYNLGGATLFLEGSYMHGFNKLQNRNFSAAPVTFGIKPNLSKLLK